MAAATKCYFKIWTFKYFTKPQLYKRRRKLLETFYFEFILDSIPNKARTENKGIKCY